MSLRERVKPILCRVGVYHHVEGMTDCAAYAWLLSWLGLTRVADKTFEEVRACRLTGSDYLISIDDQRLLYEAAKEYEASL